MAISDGEKRVSDVHRSDGEGALPLMQRLQDGRLERDLMIGHWSHMPAHRLQQQRRRHAVQHQRGHDQHGLVGRVNLQQVRDGQRHQNRAQAADGQCQAHGARSTHVEIRVERVGIRRTH